jgi:O-methyltransferase
MNFFRRSPGRGYDYVKSHIATYRNKVSFEQRDTGRVHSLVIPHATYSPWQMDPEFLLILGKIRNHTLVDEFRLYELHMLARQMKQVPGDFLEVGVWRGGSGALLARVASEMNKVVYLADTYEGVVYASDFDTSYVGGEHADTSIELVESLFRATGITNHRILPGIFPKETHQFIESEFLSLVHIDVDVYESGKLVWEYIQPKLTIGSVVVFDDFGFISCSGITKLVEEIKESPNYIFLHNLNGHGVFCRVA